MAFFLKGGGSKKDGRELILTPELPWGRKAVKQGTPEMRKEKKNNNKKFKKKILSREILVKKELKLLSKHPSSYHR